MKVWIINQGNSMPEHGHLNRHFYLSKYLSRMGHHPALFVGSHPHNTHIQLVDRNHLYQVNEQYRFPVVYVHTIAYGYSKMKRLIAYLQFVRNVCRTSRHMPLPDVIYGSSTHPLNCVVALHLAHKYHLPCVCEIRDLWPESFVAYGLLKPRHIIVRLMYQLEKYIYTKADKLIFTIEGGPDYIREKGWAIEQGGPVNLSKIHYLNNGVDLEDFNYNRENYSLPDSDLDNPDLFKVVYTGSVRRANNIGLLVDVARQLRDPRIRILVYGNGDYLESLRSQAKNEHVTNIIFKNHVDKKYIASIVSRADVNTFVLEKTTLYRFGLSLNKSFEYLAAGRPILMIGAANYSMVDRYQCGIQVSDWQVSGAVQAIEQFASMTPEQYLEMCNRAKEASQEYDFAHLANALASIIFDKDMLNVQPNFE